MLCLHILVILMSPVRTLYISLVPINDPFFCPFLSFLSCECFTPLFLPFFVPLLIFAPFWALLLCSTLFLYPFFLPLVFGDKIFTFFFRPLFIIFVIPWLFPSSLIVAASVANSFKVLIEIYDSRTFPFVLLIFIHSTIHYYLLILSNLVNNVVWTFIKSTLCLIFFSLFSSQAIICHPLNHNNPINGLCPILCLQVTSIVLELFVPSPGYPTLLLLNHLSFFNFPSLNCDFWCPCLIRHQPLLFIDSLPVITSSLQLLLPATSLQSNYMSMIFLSFSPLVLISIGSFGFCPSFPALKAIAVQIPLLMPQLTNLISTFSMSIFSERRRSVSEFFLISVLFEVCCPLFQRNGIFMPLRFEGKTFLIAFGEILVEVSCKDH